MTNVTPELIEKAKQAKTPEELAELAKAENIDMTVEEAAAYFAQLNPVSGELSDDELENVSGGACKKSYGTIVTSGKPCFTGQFVRAYEVEDGIVKWKRTDKLALRKIWESNCWTKLVDGGTCGECYNLEFNSSGSGYCGVS